MCGIHAYVLELVYTVYRHDYCAILVLPINALSFGHLEQNETGRVSPS